MTALPAEQDPAVWGRPTLWRPTAGPDGTSRETAAAREAQVVLDLTAIVEGPSLRAGGTDREHVLRLAEAGNWPPILVTRTGPRVVDGRHRLEAARYLGRTRIEAVYFDGPPEMEYVEFVRRNVGHGLPLSMAERKAAARRIIGLFPQWSDRRVAGECALAPGTVSRIRRSTGSSHDIGTGDRGTRRLGRDGRSRPLDPAAVRRSIAEALVQDPGQSLRAVARQTGASPETVRSVRLELEQAGPPCSAITPPRGAAVPDVSGRSGERSPTVLDGPWAGRGRSTSSERWWSRDAALNSTEAGRRLARWLAHTHLDRDRWAGHLNGVPVSRAYELAAEARRRAACWSEFADVLEAQPKSHR